MKIAVNELVSSQAWYLQAMDGTTAAYCEMDEASFSASPFLDKRIVMPKGGRKFKARISAIAGSGPWQSSPPLVPSRYILHISHVGSTLLSRVLGASSSCLSLREPMPLRYLAQHLQDQGHTRAWLSPEAFSELVDFALRNLGRPLGARSQVVVKCTSWVNPLGEYFLVKAPEVPKQVVAAYLALPNFVANTLKGSGGLSDLRSNAQSRLERLQKLLPGYDRPLHTMNWGEIAAMSWLCEMMTIRSVCQQPGVDLMWLDFDAFMQSPSEGARGLARHLQLTWDAGSDESLEQSGVLSKYSKSGQAVAFSNTQRQDALAKFQRDNAGLVVSAMSWLGSVAQGNAGLKAWLDLDLGRLRA